MSVFGSNTSANFDAPGAMETPAQPAAGHAPATHAWAHLRLTTMIAMVAAVQLLGMVVFSGGFLLSRVKVDMVSAGNTPIDGHATSAASSAQPPFDKALLLIVDALRLDFLFAQQYSAPGAPHVGSMNRTLDFVRSAVRLLA
jgi:hypothetical protein